MRTTRLTTLVALSLLASALPAAWSADAPLWAVREWERLPIENDPARAGLDHLTCVFYSFPARVLGLAYEQTVDPKNGDAPVYQGYGDSFMRLLNQSRFGWSFETFYYPEVWANGADGKPARATVGVLRELNVLESEGDRVVGDYVWPVKLGDREVGSLVLRCAIFAEDRTWLYARSFVTGDPSLTLKSLVLGSFGGMAGYMPPGATQWTANLADHGPAPPRGPLPLEQNWLFIAHKQGWGNWGNDQGSASVVLPETLAEFQYRDNGTICLVPPAGARSLVCALGEFVGKPDPSIARLRQEAPARQARLRSLPWAPDLAREVGLLDTSAAPLTAALRPGSPLLATWQAARDRLSGAVTAAAGAEPGAAPELAAASALQSARGVLAALWPQAVVAYVEQETRTP